LCCAGIGATLCQRMLKSKQWKQVGSYMRFEDVNAADVEMDGMSEGEQRRNELRAKYDLPTQHGESLLPKHQ
jgi:hypothetical protein